MPFSAINLKLYFMWLGYIRPPIDHAGSPLPQRGPHFSHEQDGEFMSLMVMQEGKKKISDKSRW